MLPSPPLFPEPTPFHECPFLLLFASIFPGHDQEGSFTFTAICCVFDAELKSFLPETNSSHLKHCSLEDGLEVWVFASCQVRTLSFRVLFLFLAAGRPGFWSRQSYTVTPLLDIQVGSVHFWCLVVFFGMV